DRPRRLRRGRSVGRAAGFAALPDRGEDPAREGRASGAASFRANRVSRRSGIRGAAARRLSGFLARDRRHRGVLVGWLERRAFRGTLGGAGSLERLYPSLPRARAEAGGSRRGAAAGLGRSVDRLVFVGREGVGEGAIFGAA